MTHSARRCQCARTVNPCIDPGVSLVSILITLYSIIWSIQKELQTELKILEKETALEGLESRNINGNIGESRPASELYYIIHKSSMST